MTISNKCPNCGNEVSEKSIYCSYCGFQLRELPPEIAALNLTEEERMTPKEVEIRTTYRKHGFISAIRKKKH